MKAITAPEEPRVKATLADSAFADNKHRPIHRWVPWIAGFSAELVRDALARYLEEAGKRGGVVLDPFCGVGTTLIEALRAGHDALGFEINPYAALAARTKCAAGDVPQAEISKHIDRFEQHMRAPGTGSLMTAPEHFRSRIPFFGPRTQEKVLCALQFIGRLNEGPMRDLFSLAFGAVMVSFSNYSYEPSLSSRPAAGKPLQDDAPVAETMLTKLRTMAADAAWLRAELERLPRRPVGRVVPDNFFNALQHLKPGTVDLILTSPPYLNNYHYIRNTRPQLFWLGMIHKPSELKQLELGNFGKYWQTVRDDDAVPSDIQHPGLEQLLAQVRASRAARGAYGGPGWANYAASYFNDTNRFCTVASRLLKPGARAVVVVGNSILQGIEIPVDKILADLARRHGLETEHIHIVRQKRIGASIVASSVRQGAKTKAKLYESAVVLRKI